MKVFIVICCDSDDGSILFVDSIRKNKQDAIDYCNAQNTDSRNQVTGIYFDWEEDTVL